MVALLLGAAVALLAGGPGGVGGLERLPDLDQATPSKLSITRAEDAAEPVHRLGFRSAVANVGDGRSRSRRTGRAGRRDDGRDLDRRP